LDRERWLEARKEELLPTFYFHTVFTVPEGLRPLALRNQKVVYNLLFQSASETLAQIAKDPKHLGAEIGFMGILHTWTQTLIDHPHLHGLVPGGGLSPRWEAMGLFEADLLPSGQGALRLVSREVPGWLKKSI
jgi:hypothetical protein